MGLFVLALVLPAWAQAVATLVLRNGERPSGRLVSLSMSGFVLQVNGRNRTFPTGEVSAVEFVGGAPPAEAVRSINAGTPVVVLRNGQVIEGRLRTITGNSPLRLTVDTDRGPRNFTSNEVAQIYVNPEPAQRGGGGGRGGRGGRETMPPPPPQAPSGNGISIQVSARDRWTDTGISIRIPIRLTITGSGTIDLGNNQNSGVEGSPRATVPGIRYPVAGAPAGALIARVGNGQPFAVRNGQQMTISGSGNLQLSVNDDHLDDNSGFFRVRISQ
ncbi:MAG: hypothetical protein LBQ09_11615 [Acidobacteriaceae bacterium]|nr:hypothetical protein [Acidobacteriaceae bacterium]